MVVTICHYLSLSRTREVEDLSGFSDPSTIRGSWRLFGWNFFGYPVALLEHWLTGWVASLSPYTPCPLCVVLQVPRDHQECRSSCATALPSPSTGPAETLARGPSPDTS